MFGFIKRLFTMSDRVEIASDRVALALEGMADDLERARQRVRQCLGLDDTETITVSPSLPEALPEVAPDPEIKPRRKRG